MPRKQYLAQATVIIASTLLLMASGLYGLYLIRDILLLFFVAFIIASALRPTVLRFEKRFGVPKIISVVGLQAALFTVLIAFGALLVPPLIKESGQLVSTAATLIDLPEVRWEGLFDQDAATISQTVQNFESLINRFGQSLAGLYGALSSALTTLILTVTMFVIVYYLIASFDQLAKSFAWLLPGAREEKLARANKILESVSFELGGWIRGRLIVMILIGIITYIVLSLLNVPYALALALIATLLEIVPNIGPILAAIPAIILAFFLVGPWAGLTVLIFYTVLQQIESYIITPQVMKKAVHVHPLTTVFLILVGIHLMGIKGGLLILPFYVAVRAVAKELWPNQGPLGELK